MTQSNKAKRVPTVAHYDANYTNFQSELYSEIRREAFGEDIGQNSWLTSDEQDKFLGWLDISNRKESERKMSEGKMSEGTRLLDIACGAGGPALRIAETTGCSVVGIDVHEAAIAVANSLAHQRGLAQLAEFRAADATGRLPFADASFDAIACIDAINHLPNRQGVLEEWNRLLKRHGRLLFTDPITVTGPLTNNEIAVRSSIGFFLYVPRGYDERLIADCGLRLLMCEDVSSNMAEVAERRCSSRARRSAALREIEGDETYDGQQEFLSVAARVAREGRLSRFAYVAEKP